MKALTQNIGVVAAIIMIAIAVFVYKSFFQSDASIITETLPATSISSEALETLTDLENVTFNQSVLSTAGYIMLTDFSTAIPVQPVGRPNPFNIIGR